MPKLYIYAGMWFAFYANDHLPIHLHVHYQGAELKATLIYGERDGLTITWKATRGKFPSAMKHKAERLLRAKAADIKAKWVAFRINGKDIKPERILRLR